MSSFYGFIPGDPHGKGSVRVGRWGAYKDEKTDSYMGVAVTTLRAAKTGATMTGPLVCEIVAWCRRPKSMMPKGPRAKTTVPLESFPCLTKPDLDNVAKTIGDCLTQAGIIEDDRMIVVLTLRKVYVATAPEHGNVDVGVGVSVRPWKLVR